MHRLRTEHGGCAIAAPVWHELVFGCRILPPASARRKTLERYLEEVVSRAFPVLSYDTAAAAWHADERARLAAKGVTPPFVDGQIAAVARINRLVLVTPNLRDFRRFEGLAVENWFN